MKKLLTLLTLTTTIFSVTHANSGISLGQPGYGGSGCPSGTASATLSPDSKSLSIIFDEYFVEAGGDTRKRMARKNCSIAIPVHVPQGFSVSIIDVDYRGYISLPRGARARFSAEYFFAGQRGPRFVKSFRGSFDDDYMISNSLGVNAIVYSKCGVDVNLRVSSSMMVRTNRKKQEVLATVDSADFSSGIVYQLQWKRCDQFQDEDPFDPWDF